MGIIPTNCEIVRLIVSSIHRPGIVHVEKVETDPLITGQY